MPNHKINIVQYSFRKHRASVLHPTLTTMAAQGHTDLEGLVECPSLGCCLLTTGSDHILTQKSKRHFTVHLEMGLSHRLKCELKQEVFGPRVLVLVLK